MRWGRTISLLGALFSLAYAAGEGAVVPKVEGAPRAEAAEALEQAFLLEKQQQSQSAVTPAQPNTPENTMKQAGQFLLFGGDSVLQGGLALRAEEEKSLLRNLVPFDIRWKTPIWIHLYGKPGDAAPLKTCSYALEQTEAGYVLRLNLHLGHGVNEQEFRRGILTLLLYEQAIRELSATASDVELHVPTWLVLGLDEAIDWQQKRGDRRLYETLFQHGGLFQLKDLLKVTDADEMAMDSATRATFRGSSGALVMALLSQSDGKTGFVEFLKRIPSYRGETAQLLREYFPDLNLSEKSLAKWWQLQMMSMATAKVTESMSVVETDAALVAALKLRIRNAEGAVQNEEMAKWETLKGMTRAERSYATRTAQDQLMVLSYRCFPSYRPLLSEYQQFLNALSAKEFLTPDQQQTWAKKLLDLEKVRQGMIARTERAGDYLNWFEITRARVTSGQFTDYIRLKQRLEQQGNVPRTDRVSAYLDRMEKVFYRKGQTKGKLAAASSVLSTKSLSTELPEELRQTDGLGIPSSDQVLPIPDASFKPADSVTPLPPPITDVLPLNADQVPTQ